MVISIRQDYTWTYLVINGGHNGWQNKEDYDISKIDTVEQAYISAWIEKNYDYILVNLPNYFFKNTLEIIDWIKHYPEHYKAVNPNLPVFNEYPNPFYLHKKQK